MITLNTKLTVKELATPLGLSVWTIYKMRQAGLPMKWEAGSNVATVLEVKQWISKSGFRVINGRVKVGCKT